MSDDDEPSIFEAWNKVRDLQAGQDERRRQEDYQLRIETLDAIKSLAHGLKGIKEEITVVRRAIDAFRIKMK